MTFIITTLLAYLLVTGVTMIILGPWFMTYWKYLWVPNQVRNLVKTISQIFLLYQSKSFQCWFLMTFVITTLLAYLLVTGVTMIILGPWFMTYWKYLWVPNQVRNLVKTISQIFLLYQSKSFQCWFLMTFVITTLLAYLLVTGVTMIILGPWFMTYWKYLWVPNQVRNLVKTISQIFLLYQSKSFQCWEGENLKLYIERKITI